MPLFKKKNDDVVESIKYEEEDNKIKTPSYLLPGILVTTLFFLWGFSYGLLDTLNKHFKNVLGLSKLTCKISSMFYLQLVRIATTETTYMQVAYFGAYFIFSIP